jgi:hypothetical protein
MGENRAPKYWLARKPFMNGWQGTFFYESILQTEVHLIFYNAVSAIQIIAGAHASFLIPSVPIRI